MWLTLVAVAEARAWGLTPGEWVTVGLTAALVGVTGFYALQTKQTVEAMQTQTEQTVGEMRRARGVQVLPRIVPTVSLRGAGVGFFRIVNVGPGPALNVNIEYWFEPGGDRQAWRSPVMAPGEYHDFGPKAPDGTKTFHLDKLVTYFAAMRIEGTCTDALGDTHHVDAEADLRETWELVKSSEEIVPPDNMRKIVSEMEKLRKEVEKISGNLGKS